ncbi:MAG: high-potential iron-sulfur protein [Pseudomonadota bacterium]
MKKIARRTFFPLPAAAGAIVTPTRQAYAKKPCASWALVQGNDGDEWRPCPILLGKSGAAAGWCAVGASKR